VARGAADFLRPVLDYSSEVAKADEIEEASRLVKREYNALLWALNNYPIANPG
jgi:hypothetical protein